MKKTYKFYFQGALLAVLVTCLVISINNLTINLSRAGIGLSLSWLLRPASFALAEHPLPYSPSNSYAWALFMGWLNSLKVICVSLFLATFIGVFAGISRTSSNNLLGIIISPFIIHFSF